MTRARLLSLLLLPLLGACSNVPEKGCLLAVGNQREILRSRSYLRPAIPSRILDVQFRGQQIGHVALVYRLTPEGWHVYDSLFGSRPLWAPNTPAFPAPLLAARQAFPAMVVTGAEWYESALTARQRQ